MIKAVGRYPGGLILSALAASLTFLLAIYFYYPPVTNQALIDQKLIALTVDDGPDPRFSPVIVDICRKNNIHATFFVIGEQVEKYPDLLRMEYVAGNEIGNHSYTHQNLNHLNRLSIRDEIKRTNGIICKTIGYNVYWFRPPRKHYNLRVIQEAEDQGLNTVLWTSVVETAAIRDPVQMARRIIRGARPGGIILLHDGGPDRALSVKALPMIIEGLSQKGYRFVTLSELLPNEGESK